MSAEIRTTVSDALDQLHAKFRAGNGWRYPARVILRSLAETSWRDGYVEGSRDAAEQRLEDRAAVPDGRPNE